MTKRTRKRVPNFWHMNNGVMGDGCGECPACKLRRHGLEEYLKVRGYK